MSGPPGRFQDCCPVCPLASSRRNHQKGSANTYSGLRLINCISDSQSTSERINVPSRSTQSGTTGLGAGEVITKSGKRKAESGKSEASHPTWESWKAWSRDRQKKGGRKKAQKAHHRKCIVCAFCDFWRRFGFWSCFPSFGFSGLVSAFRFLLLPWLVLRGGRFHFPPSAFRFPLSGFRFPLLA